MNSAHSWVMYVTFSNQGMRWTQVLYRQLCINYLIYLSHFLYGENWKIGELLIFIEKKKTAVQPQKKFFWRRSTSTAQHDYVNYIRDPKNKKNIIHKLSNPLEVKEFDVFAFTSTPVISSLENAFSSKSLSKSKHRHINTGLLEYWIPFIIYRFTL